MNIPPNVREAIVEELRKPASIEGAVARRYGLTLDQVKTLKEEEGLAPKRVFVSHLTHIDRVPERLRPFVVAIKHLSDPWPNDDRVREAKMNYDCGLSETAIGRVHTDDPENDLMYFCEFPRKVSAARRHPYFSRVAA